MVKVKPIKSETKNNKKKKVSKTKYWQITLTLILVVLVGALIIIEINKQTEQIDILTTNIDLQNKTIKESPQNSYTANSWLAISWLANDIQRWFSSNLNVWQLYQNLANPSAKYIVLNAGLRKEQITDILGKELNWTVGEKNLFLAADTRIDKKNMEGYYHPGSYLISITARPSVVYKKIINKFNEEVTDKYATSTASIINIDLALKVASIIEREASGTKDMRLISGVIWNRIFKDMTLDMDATLQYAKGNKKNGWWPSLTSKDKYIDSPYNTYKNKGLPPTPISNVSIAAIKSALNPQKTDCIFYLHDKKGKIHCSITYKEHLNNIKKYYR